MKSTKTFNNISDGLKKQIPKLKKGEVVHFQMLNGVPNPEPDPRERAKQGEVLYGKVQLMTTFRIYDKHIKDEDGNEVGGYVDVGCVDQWRGDQPERFRRFIPGITPVHLHNVAFGGKFDLVGGNVADEELYEILYISPERQGSPCQDDSFEVKFKIIDDKSTAKSSVNKFERLKRAIEVADKISDRDARRVLSALNQPIPQDTELLKAAIKTLSKDKTDVFLDTYDNHATNLEYTLKEAQDAGIIRHQLNTGEVFMGDVVITTIKVDVANKFLPEFARWINNASNGNDVLENIKSRMSNKETV